jgi:hypothetical protein
MPVLLGGEEAGHQHVAADAEGAHSRARFLVRLCTAALVMA